MKKGKKKNKRRANGEGGVVQHSSQIGRGKLNNYLVLFFMELGIILDYP